MAEAASEYANEKELTSDPKSSSSLSVNSSAEDSSFAENDSFLFFSYLEEIEDRIESLRRHATALSQEKSSLLLVLSQLKEESMTAALKKDEFQEICENMDRLRVRCKAVDINVETIRSPEQHQGYLKVCALVDELEQSLSITDDKPPVIKRAKSYLNACSSDVVDGNAIDFKFQGMILDCVVDDQKAIRYRLENIVNNSLRSSRPAVISENDYLSAEGDHSENCIKPSAISSAVKNSPHFDEASNPLSTNECKPVPDTKDRDSGWNSSNSDNQVDNHVVKPLDTA